MRKESQKPESRGNILTMPASESSLPYGPLFETHVGLPLFWCARATRGINRNQRERQDDLRIGQQTFVRHSFGPAPLSKGRIAFNFFEKGNWSVILNGQRELYRPGDLGVVRGGDSCGWSCERPGPHSTLTIGLAMDQGEVDNILLHRKFNVHYSLAQPKEFSARFDQLLETLAKPLAVREWAVTGAALLLIALIFEQTAPPLRQGGATALSMAGKTRFAQTWANANLASKIVLAEWARTVNLHPKSFERVFKEHTGCSPKRWLEIQRLQVARQY